MRGNTPRYATVFSFFTLFHCPIWLYHAYSLNPVLVFNPSEALPCSWIWWYRVIIFSIWRSGQMSPWIPHDWNLVDVEDKANELIIIANMIWKLSRQRNMDGSIMSYWNYKYSHNSSFIFHCGYECNSFYNGVKKMKRTGKLVYTWYTHKHYWRRDAVSYIQAPSCKRYKHTHPFCQIRTEEEKSNIKELSS
jgi:hypothetical protein